MSEVSQAAKIKPKSSSTKFDKSQKIVRFNFQKKNVILPTFNTEVHNFSKTKNTHGYAGP